jgi:hypothetical protein
MRGIQQKRDSEFLPKAVPPQKEKKGTEDD